MQNAIYTNSPIFRFLHHLKFRDRLNLCIETVVSKRDISRSNCGLKSPMLCRTRYTPAAEFFKARYTPAAEFFKARYTPAAEFFKVRYTPAAEFFKVRYT